MASVILTIIIAIVATFVVGSLVGWVAHWLMHTWLAKTRLFKFIATSHNSHHVLYTTEDFESETYRSAGKDTSSFVFVPIIGIAILILCAVMWWIFEAWYIYPVILIEGIVIGYLNDRLHDCFHITNHWLNRYSWFSSLKRLHWNHHDDPEVNHGIIWFIPDKIFGTFKNESYSTQSIK